SRRRSPNRPSAISIGHPPMPGAFLDKPKLGRVRIYQWGSESNCRTKCVHTLARRRGTHDASPDFQDWSTPPDRGEVVPHCPGIGMFGAERLLVDRLRALVERPRRGEIALVLQQEGEVVEALRGIGVVGAERLLVDRQCAFEERSRRGEFALRL